MANNSLRKRPCCICRKWFLPDVRQNGRQRTCSPECRRELHRRQCEKLNRKNKAVHKNNYLAKQLEQTESKETTSKLLANLTKRPKEPVLPMEVIVTEYGIKPAVIIQYLVDQVINHANDRICGFP